MRTQFLFALLAVAITDAAEGWQSPDKFYSIFPPDGWTHTEDKGSAGSSYAFKSPDGKAEVRISATYHLKLPEVLPDEVLELAFPKERGIARSKGCAAKIGMVCGVSTLIRTRVRTGWASQHVEALL